MCELRICIYCVIFCSHLSTVESYIGTAAWLISVCRPELELSLISFSSKLYEENFFFWKCYEQFVSIFVFLGVIHKKHYLNHAMPDIAIYLGLA